MGADRIPVSALCTARLVLRPIQLSDAEAIQRLFSRWEIVRQLHAPWPFPHDGALNFCRDVLAAAERGENWTWTLRLKSAPADLIGAISLRLNDVENRAFWIGLSWQGQGLMSEASAATMDFWFRTLRRDVFRVSKAAENAASRRISESAGMRVIGTKMGDYASGPLLTEIWEITREEWDARRTQDKSSL